MKAIISQDRTSELVALDNTTKENVYPALIIPLLQDEREVWLIKYILDNMPLDFYTHESVSEFVETLKKEWKVRNSE